MTTSKLVAGEKLPDVIVPILDGGTTNLASPAGNNIWKLIIVYRGKHCPLCTKQLTELKEHMADFTAANVGVIAVSADSAEKAQAHMAELKPNFEVAYDLSFAQMQTLGVYVSDPISDAETYTPFAEPGLFIINTIGDTQFINVSNAPFLRPDFSSVLNGISFVRNPENYYPIRGTRAYI